MFNMFIYGTTALLVGLWGLAILALLSITFLPAEFQLYVLPLAGITLVVHFIEYMTTKEKFKNKTNTDLSFVQTMLWGYGYWLPIMKNSTEK